MAARVSASGAELRGSGRNLANTATLVLHERGEFIENRLLY